MKALPGAGAPRRDTTRAKFAQRNLMNVNYLLGDPKGGRERLQLGPLPHERGSPTAQADLGISFEQTRYCR
jgi:hypothetical protein